MNLERLASRPSDAPITVGVDLLDRSDGTVPSEGDETLLEALRQEFAQPGPSTQAAQVDLSVRFRHALRLLGEDAD